MIFDMGLRRVSPIVDRLLAIAMREVGMVRCLFVMLRGFLVMVCGLLGHGLLLRNIRYSMPKRRRAGWSQLLTWKMKEVWVWDQQFF
jgi:hypothetical protein